MADPAFIVIAGPTAVGKTAVALALARRISGEIVCADSRTLYRGMNIGTAKPSAADRASVPHHLIDVADPDHVVTLAEYQRRAVEAFREIRARGRLPILVGGTGLFIRAVVDRVAVPPVPPDWDLRARLEAAERLEGPGTLHRRLRRVDPAAASRIHPRNIRRIIRALEVHSRGGAAISTLQPQIGPEGWVPPREAPDPAVMVALTMDRDWLYRRIDRRIDEQLASGLVGEVRALLAFGYARTLPAMQGLGYKEIAAYLDGILTLAEAVARIRRNSRRYARRQWTWFRADPRYRWLESNDRPPEAVAAEIHAIMSGDARPRSRLVREEEGSMRIARRMEQIPPYLFADLNRKRAELKGRGVDVIDISIGDPDLPTPDHIIEALARAARDPSTHTYPPYEGTRAFREAAAGWYARRFGVALDPGREVLTLIGSKEGLAHLPWVFVNPGDVTLVSDPGYPVYATATLMAEGQPYPVPMCPERGWRPDLGAIPGEVARRARLFFLNYPNNPTAGVADLAFFQEVVEFARRWDILVVHDNTYSEIAYDEYRPPSFLEAPGAREVGIELHSLSKTYCMTGWRIGFAVGNPAAIQALGILKTNIDSGQFAAIQAAGVAALTGPDTPVRERVARWQARRDAVVAGLRGAGLDAPMPKATFYLWVPIPAGYDSVGFASHLLEQAGVVVAPGIGYGKCGEGYIRISLTTADNRFAEAVARIGQSLGAPTSRARV